MAATDPITVEATARTLLENALAWNENPALTTVQVDTLLSMAESADADTGTPQWTTRDLNRVTSLGCQWKASAAADQFKAGVGSGKTFELQQVYDHWIGLAGLYGTGQMSVVGSVDVDDGTGAPGRRGKIGSIGLTSVMTETA